MNILVLNTGSSSLKFQIIETDLEKIDKSEDKTLAKGLVERIGSQSVVTFKVGNKKIKNAVALRDHKAAIFYVTQWITDPETSIPGINGLEDIHAIGHRTVHGGEKFNGSVAVTDDVIRAIEDCIDLAPLHNPPNIKGINAAREVFGMNIPQVAVFDTAFHSTMPEINYLYGIPYQLYRRYGIRKYGFHGTSHRYIAYGYRKISGKTRENTNIITCHLGNGSSLCCIKNGKSYDTSMGFTPLEGLIMGTRSGDVDPGIIDFIAHKEGISLEEVISILNKRSGVLGISGLSNDMRDLEIEVAEHNDRRAKLALDMFAHRVKKYIGAYLVELNGCDAICFSAGIGENAPEMREAICADLQNMGIKIDPKLNKQAVGGKEMKISAKDSAIEVYVIPTNEELVLARDTCRVVLGAPLH